MAVTISNSGVKCDSVTQNLDKKGRHFAVIRGGKKAKKLLSCLMCGPLHHC